MFKSKKIIVAALAAFLLLVFLRAPLTRPVLSQAGSFAFLNPISWVYQISGFFGDLFSFSKNAALLREYRKKDSAIQYRAHQLEELKKENLRLSHLLKLKTKIPASVKKAIFCRVMGSYQAVGSRTLILDKGTQDGITEHMLVLSNLHVIGKITEVNRSTSRVTMIHDPASRLGVMMVQSRDQAILYGTASGDCRVKYIPQTSKLNIGDRVMTAGFLGLLPKGLLVGEVISVGRQSGQMYQTAVVKPFADLSRIEEVVCVQ